MRLTATLALVFFAATAFADALRSDRHLVKIEVSNGASRQYNVQIFDAESRGSIAHLKLTTSGNTPAEAETTANGTRYAVRIAPHGEAYLVDFTAQGGEMTDAMRGGFTTRVKPAPAAPPQAMRGGRDVKEPKLLRRIEPVYTEEAKAAGAAGSVLVEVLIDRSGFVRDATVVRGLGHGLSESAVEAVKQWQFEATMQSHVPVEVELEVTVEFKP